MLDQRPGVTTIPPHFAQAMIEVFEDEGRAWLDSVPALIAEHERRWSLRVLPAFPNLSYNYVAPAVRSDGTEVVLKLGVPRDELRTEVEALKLYDGQGMVRLLEADGERGVMLLERLSPGTPLSHLEDEAATSIAAGIMRQLWRSVPEEHPFPTVADWAAGLAKLRPHFGGGTGPLPPRLVDEAERLFADLLASTTEPVLLHGDLHHDNILSAERAPWLALDPKGIVGDRGFEVGPLLHNPMPQILTWPDLRGVLARRVDQLSEELGMERGRVRGWGLAHAILSAWWSIEDHGHGWETALTVAEHLSALPE